MRAPWLRRGTTVAADVAVLILALYFAFALRFDWDVPAGMSARFWFSLPYIVGLQFGALVAFSVHRFAWRFVGLREVVRIGFAVALASAVVLTARLGLEPVQEAYPRVGYAMIPMGVIAIDAILAVMGLTATRAMRRLVGEQQELNQRRGQRERDPILIVGAGDVGLSVARELAQHPELGAEPVGFVDDDPSKVGSIVAGHPVLGPTSSLPALCEASGAREVFIALAAAPGSEVRRIQGLCDQAGAKAKIIPSLSELVGGSISVRRFREVRIEDLLRREPVRLEQTELPELIAGKVVLVTGGGGSIGSELCRQLASLRPKLLIVLERSEGSLFEIERELRRRWPELELEAVLGDCGDKSLVEPLFRRLGPDLILHAAAHKHVPIVEANPVQAVLNNVCATRVVAQAALEHKVDSFVLISTDKAVRPTSVMGGTKRVAEQIVRNLARVESCETRFCAVRFGNVLGSAGSVVPIFREQIARGGPVTVTHPQMTRYFMTIPEACALVLQSGAMARGGEVFVLDMGDPVRIVDLAQDLIRLSGLRPEVDIELAYSGIRPGEKLFEELSSLGELHRTAHPKIQLESAAPAQAAQVEETVARLVEAAEQGGKEAGLRVRGILEERIPDFGRLNADTGIATAAEADQQLRP